MSQKNPLQSYVSRSLVASGAVVDGDAQQLHCLLPPPLAQALATDEELHLHLPGIENKGQVLNYEHSLLENLFDHIQQEGRLTHIELSDVSSRSGGLRNVFQQSVQLSQGIGEIERVNTSHCSYLLVHFRIDAHCQENSFRELTSLACNEETLVRSNWLTEDLTHWPHQKVNPQFWRNPFPEIYDHFQKQLSQSLEESLLPFTQKIKQQISRKRRRIERLHRRERKEILQPLKDDPSLDPTPFLENLKEAGDQYTQTLLAIPSQYPVTTQISPLSALRVTIPVTRVEYNIRLRKKDRTTSWIWNPIVEQFEPLRCENCGTERYHIVPTPDLQLHCPSCT